MSNLFTLDQSAIEPRPAITALAPWFGSKRTLAPRIVDALGPHRAYWEPFCGSMAVLLAKPPCAMETLNDLHLDLINLARVIRCPVRGPMLYRRVRRWLVSNAANAEASCTYKWHVDRPLTDSVAESVDRAEAYFVSSWMGRNGVSGTQSYNQGFSRRFTARGGNTAKRYAGAVESIPAWRRRLREVTILGDDAFTLIPKIADDAGTAIYIDPPYVTKRAAYVHDLERDDHVELARLTGRFSKARVVVSYYDHPLVRELYPASRWQWVHVPVAKSLVNQGMRDQESPAVAPEVLIVNG